MLFVCIGQVLDLLDAFVVVALRQRVLWFVVGSFEALALSPVRHVVGRFGSTVDLKGGYSAGGSSLV